MPSDPDRLAELTVLVPPDARTEAQSATAYFLIRDMIVTLELKPGDRLDERELVQRLALGRTPIREALRRLADEGLVVIYARRGMVVAPVDVRTLGSVSEVRVELEALGARLAAQRADDHDRETAADLVAELDGLDGDDGPRALIRLDQRVHHCLYRATHNTYLQNTLAEYLALSLRLWFMGLDRVSRLDDAVAEHRDVLAAILDRDADRAEKVVRAHVLGFWSEIREVLIG